MTDEEIVPSGTDEQISLKPSAFHTIVFGGLAIGIGDFIDASTFFRCITGLRFNVSGRVSLPACWDAKPRLRAAGTPLCLAYSCTLS